MKNYKILYFLSFIALGSVTVYFVSGLNNLPIAQLQLYSGVSPSLGKRMVQYLGQALSCVPVKVGSRASVRDY